MNDDVFQRALAVRRCRFGPELRLSVPSFKRFQSVELACTGGPSFAAISVTGSACALGCDHCRGRLLEAMKPATDPAALLETATKLAARGGEGLLVSGGCDAAGRVPLEPFLPTLERIGDTLGLRVAVHTGLVDDDLARGLAQARVTQVMVDLVGDVATAREVLHLDAPPERFEASLDCLLRAGLVVTPHVVVGLHRGAIRGERAALALAARHPIAALVFVVVRPVPGTPFADVTPPAPADVGRLLAEARLILPTTPLHLGCARPLGPAGREIEALAVRAGVNGIAFPADATVRLARQLGFVPDLAERCCAM